jgi:hypothetical protein
VSAVFKAPGPASILAFGPVALAAAVGRTATTRQARPQLLAGLQKSALAQLECLISNSPAFELAQDFADLAIPKGRCLPHVAEPASRTST